MYKNKKITIYFPCRNESSHLQEVINTVPTFVDEIIIVSNKSTDDTYEKAQKLGLRSLKDDRTVGGIGYGFAHMTGLSHATGDIIISADADLTYPVDKIADIIDYFLEHEMDFVSCNRYPIIGDTKIPFKLQLGVNLLNWETKFLYGVNIQDILSGMWILNKSIIPKLELTMGEWNLSPQIKINAALHDDIKFSEYHIVQHQRAGETKQNHWKTGFQHLFWIAKNFVGVETPMVLDNKKAEYDSPRKQAKLRRATA